MTMPDYPENSPRAILFTRFGYDNFRDHQEEIINQVVSGRDALVLMPTGSGKSICYQIPAMIRPGVGVVISPLIALMQDQVDAVRQLGIRAEFLNSTLSPEEARAVERNVLYGQLDLLYVAPERFMMPGFQALLDQSQVALFAIDEAHCVSQWGHDFRPEYLQLSILPERFPEIPRIAVTATADLVTRTEIIEKLKLENAGQFISSLDRTNLYYRVELKENEKVQLLDFLRTEHPNDSGIVYCLSRRRVDVIADWLAGKGFTALPYHAGMEKELRLRHQQRFLREESVIIVATIAFGMGIDKPEVRFVVHLDLPKTLEGYYQETGRAGRDGEKSDAWMLYGLGDVVTLRQMLAASEGDEQFKRIQQRKMEAMLGFCETTRCRRQVLLSYFGEDLPEPCGYCDTCAGKLETRDGTIEAQKALSCVYRTGQRFGTSYLTDVLLGKVDERIRRFGHDKVSTFGIGKELSKQEWKSVFRQLVAAGLLSVDLEGKGGFRLAPRAWPVLRGEEKFALRKDPGPVTPERRSRIRPDRIRPDLPSAPTSGELWEKLRSLRLEIARKQGIAPFTIFHDSTLREMARTLPRAIEEMSEVSGIGERKLELYGKQLLALILDHLQKHAAPPPEAKPDAGEQEDSLGIGHPLSTPSIVIEQIPDGELPIPGLNELVDRLPPKRPDESFTEERLIEIRKKNPRAYEPWSDEEDRMLARLYHEGQSVALLAKIFQRQPGAIASRIRKLAGA